MAWIWLSHCIFSSINTSLMCKCSAICLPPLWPRNETVQHLLLVSLLRLCSSGLVYKILQKLGLASGAPQPTSNKFSTWWCQAVKGVPKGCWKGQRGSTAWSSLSLGKSGSTKMTDSLMARAQTSRSCCRLSLMNAFCGAQLGQKVFRSCLLRHLLEAIDLFWF